MPVGPILVIQAGIVLVFLLVYDEEIFVFGLGLLAVYVAFDLGLFFFIKRGGRIDKPSTYAALCAFQLAIVVLMALARYFKLVWGQ